MVSRGTESERMVPRSDPPPVENVEPSLPDGTTVTLWLRASAPRVAQERQTRIRERVVAFDDAGVETTVREWPRRVTDPGTDSEQAAMTAFDRYRAVAGRLGVRLDPFFECRTNPDGSRTVVFPVACLALERDGELTGLYPCYVDGDHAAIEDGLDAVEEGSADNLR